MAGKNTSINDHHIRTLDKSLWQEYLTMPSIRVLDCPDYKTYAVALKEAGRGRLLEQMWEQFRARRAVGTKKIVEIENHTILQNKAAFINSTTVKSQRATLNRYVQLGLRVAESDLDTKRNKLKALVLKEETDLTHEYVDRAQKLAEELLKQKKKKVDEIVRKQEQEREEQARMRREQQIRENSQDFRNFMSKNLKLESAEVQKHQICEKMMQKEREEEFEQFWLDIALKLDDERKKYEEHEETIRLTKIQEQRESLNKQIIGKKIMQDEMKQVKKAENDLIDKLKERFKEEEEKEKEFIQQQKLELKKQKLAELEENQKLKMEKDSLEKKFDAYYCKKVAENIEKDKLQNQDRKAENRREAEFFKKYLKEIHAAKIEEERQIEALRDREVAKKEAIIIQNQNIMREAKEKLQRETLETWKQQLLHKQQVLESEKEAEKLADKWTQVMYDKNLEIDQMLDDFEKGEEVKHSDNLNKQIEYEHVLNKRRIMEGKDFSKEQEEREHYLNEIWKSYKPCPDPMHPFTKVLLNK